MPREGLAYPHPTSVSLLRTEISTVHDRVVSVEVACVLCPFASRIGSSSSHLSRAGRPRVCLLEDAHCRTGSQAGHGLDCTYLSTVYTRAPFLMGRRKLPISRWMVTKRGSVRRLLESAGGAWWGCRLLPFCAAEHGPSWDSTRTHTFIANLHSHVNVRSSFHRPFPLHPPQLL